MPLLDGRRVIDLRQVGHIGWACALTIFALLVPLAGPASAASPGGSSSASGAASSTSVRPTGAGSTGSRFVNYGGVRVTVPKSWPVIDLRAHPQTCVRFDRPAVYLGPAGSQSDCPAHAVGRVDTIWLRTVATGWKDPLTSRPAKVGRLAARVDANLTGHDKHAHFTAQGVELEATWGADSTSVDQVLASAEASSGPSASTSPTAPATAPAKNTPSAAVGPATPNPVTATTAATSTMTGMAFDTCAAPSVATMRSWRSSPYRAAGIYIGGSMRACGDGNLSSTWVAEVRSMGWGLMPIYVGAQAPCVNQANLATITPSQAAAQGRASADDAVTQAQRFGLVAGTPIYYDMEAYNTSVAGCSQTVMTFISAWTSELHRRGYTSGAYGSTGSLMVDMSRSVGTSGFAAPDEVWFAHWNQLQTTSDAISYPDFPDRYWSRHQRLHQYSGGTTQSWGGASVNIDANWVDAAVAGTAVPVNYGTNVVGPGGNGFVFTGSMAYWRPGAPAGLKGLSYWTYSERSTETNGATWSPQLSPGLYDVAANIPATNATARAHYTVSDAVRTTSKVVDQKPISGYTSLGTFTAGAGRSISVHVGDDDPSLTTTRIGVDAMAFRLIAVAPGPPGAVRATGGDGAATIGWSAASANGSSVTGYTVTASPGGRTTTTTEATTATMTGLTNGTSYTFAVTATNAAGISARSAPSNAVTPSALGQYTSVNPVRVMDTRAGLGVPKAKVGPGGQVTLTVPALPAGATAVALNITVTKPTASSYLSVYPGGQPRPSVSNLNFVTGQTIPNLVIARVGAGHTVTFYNRAGTVDIVGDLAGYYAPGVGAGYTSVNPVRVMDTRAGLGVPKAKVGPGGQVTLTVPALPAGATAVALNITVTKPTASSYLSVYPGGQPRPSVSNLNFVTGQTIPNLVIARVGAGHTVTFYNRAGTVDIVGDLAGYYAPGVGAGYTSVNPVRVMDTRAGLGVPNAKVGPGGQVTLTVPALPAGATAVALNITVTKPTASSYLSVYPGGQPRPSVSNLNFVTGQTIPNLVIARVGAGHTVTFYNRAGTVDIVGDLAGYYSP